MELQIKRLCVVGLLGIVAAVCASTTPAMPNPVTEPMIDQPGRHIVRYRDAVIEIVIDTKFASSSLGAEWLVLNMALSGMTGGQTKVEREMVSVRTPDGRTITLPSYREFNADYKTIAPIARRAAIASDPLDFTRGGRRDCLIDFFPLPGSGRSARLALLLNKNEFCVGMFYFPIKNGIQPGNWKLVVEFEETEAVVPFTLEIEGQ
jgi:hypothetical protein